MMNHLFKKRLSRALSLVFFILILGAAIFYNTSKPVVMVVHSYHPDYAWTRDVDEGLRRVMDQWTGCAVVRHYMDTKRVSDARWVDRAGILARQAVDRNRPRVLIAVDDLAQSLVAKHFVGHPEMEIVFAGVNGSIDAYGYPGAANVTGIFERKQLTAVRETILAMEGNHQRPAPRLAYILDGSHSLGQGRPYIDGFDWSPLAYTGSTVVTTFADWKRAVRETGETADYILVANYRKLGDAQTGYADPKTVMAWTDAHSKVPVIGINAFNVEDGAMLSIGVSPFEQGETAASMAAEILKTGQRAGTIPMVNNKQYIVAIREASLNRRQMKLPAVYEAFGRATENFIETEADQPPGKERQPPSPTP